MRAEPYKHTYTHTQYTVAKYIIHVSLHYVSTKHKLNINFDR